MNILTTNLSRATDSRDFHAQTKLLWLAQTLRVLSVSYAVWVLVRVLLWWTDSEKVIKNMGLYLGRDLTALSASPRLMAMALDLGAWLLLLAAVVCCWNSLGYLIKAHTFTHPMARLLTWAGWLGALCQLLTLLLRPLQTYLLTAHLSAAEHVFKWAFYPQDLLGTMLCGVLLCFAYLTTWAVDVAEENRGFI
jgi:hypothetical protein